MNVLAQLSRYLPPARRRHRSVPLSRRVLPRVEPLEGRAVMAAIATPPIFQNPFMAPNNFSEIHLNSYQTDTFSVRGPGSFRSQVVRQALIAPPIRIAGSIAFNSSGQIVTVRTGPEVRSLGSEGAQTLLLMDPARLRVLDRVNLPPRPSTGGTVSFAGGGYFYLDNLDRVVLVTTTQEIRIYSVRNNRFKLDQTFNLGPAINNPSDILNSVLPDSAGNLWFITKLGTVGYADPSSGQVRVTSFKNVAGANTNEANTKSFSTDGQGGVFVVSDYALYRFQVGAGGAPTASWRTTYDRGTRTKSGQNQQGSGTTPTSFDDFQGNQFVAIADNADPFLHVNVYNRSTGVLVAQQAVFNTLPRRNSTENSLIAVNHSILVENNYGNSSIKDTLGRRTTEPGVDRVDFDPTTGQSRVVWDSTSVSVPSVVSQLSTADGLMYTYAKDARGWFWAALDYQTGEVVARSRVPLSNVLGGALANNFYSGLTIGPDGSAYVGVFGGIVAWRPRGSARP
jgi:hypothetical protein